MSAYSLPQLLQDPAMAVGPVVPHNLNAADVCRLNFTAQNPLIQAAELQDTSQFDQVVQQMLGEQNASVGVGGYLENRDIYRRSTHFNTTEAQRTIYLGVDIWMPAFTPVLAPLAGRVHSFRDNSNFGDYGPTIILEHQLGLYTF